MDPTDPRHPGGAPPPPPPPQGDDLWAVYYASLTALQHGRNMADINFYVGNGESFCDLLP